MLRLMTMRAALADPEVFAGVLPGESWAAWRVVLIASQGEPLVTPEEREIFRELTGGRKTPPDAPVRELVAVCGRRAGKTRAMAVAAAYFARFVDYTGDFAPGQRGRVIVMAASRDTAGEAFRYIKGVFEESTACSEYLDGDPTADTIRLTNSIDVVVQAASFKTTRGPTPVAVVADEIAFWSVDGANPDVEVMRALRPGLATLGGPLLILSSPYARRGVLWERYRKHFGPEGDPSYLVIQAPTAAMHESPTLLAEEEAAYEDDPVAASAEWGARFRTDSEAFVSIEIVQAVTPRGVREIPPVPKTAYVAFVDVSGGGDDSHVVAIAHNENGVAVLDAVRERKGSPESVVSDFAALIRSYGLSSVTGDGYGKAWVSERFAANGVTYVKTDRNKSQIYGEMLPILNSEKCRLLDAPKLEKQLTSLERKTTRGTGRDVIDHPQIKGYHDDVANAVAGAIVLAFGERKRRIEFSPEVIAQIAPPKGSQQYHRNKHSRPSWLPTRPLSRRDKLGQSANYPRSGFNRQDFYDGES